MANPNEDSLNVLNPNDNSTYILYVELSFGFRARDDSSLAFAIMMFNKGCIYIKLYFFTKFDK